jgi:Domain of unknown function (DUF4404)
MPRAKIENIMTELHEHFGSTEPSAQQQKLMQDLEAHMHSTLDPEPADPSLIETVELVLESLGDEHPRTAVIVRELLDTLKNIGV